MLSSWSESICSSYPPPEIFAEPNSPTKSDLKYFTRIVLTEGVPAVFRDFPLAYEVAREHVARRLGIDAKYVSLTGSARIGYSLAPEKFGTPYDQSRSDFDLFAVDRPLFERAVAEFESFIKSWNTGLVEPRHDAERGYWDDNRGRAPTNVQKGFLNLNYIPLLPQFPLALQAGNAAFWFQRSLQQTTPLRFRKSSSIRVYKDWDSAIRQIAFTLMKTLEGRGCSVP